jgi:hypothetical protein
MWPAHVTHVQISLGQEAVDHECFLPLLSPPIGPLHKLRVFPNYPGKSSLRRTRCQGVLLVGLLLNTAMFIDSTLYARMSMFSGCNNFTIHNGIFNLTHGDAKKHNAGVARP